MRVTLSQDEVAGQIHEGLRLKMARAKLSNPEAFNTFRMTKTPDGGEAYDFDTYRPVQRRAPERRDREEDENRSRSYAELLACR